MFRRLIFEDWVSLFPLIALITAGSVYATFFIRAVRMKRPQIDRLSSLPFETETSSAPNDESR